MKELLVSRFAALVMAVLMMVTANACALAEEGDTPAENVSNVTQVVIVDSPSAADLLDLPPELVLKVTSNLEDGARVLVGTEMVLTLTVEGAEGYEYTIQWQQTRDVGVTWEDVPGATDHQLRISLDPSHSGMYWRAVVNIAPSAAE